MDFLTFDIGIRNNEIHFGANTDPYLDLDTESFFHFSNVER